MCAIVNQKWTDLTRYAKLAHWKEILATLVTYAGRDEFASLCGKSSISSLCLHFRVFHGHCYNNNYYNNVNFLYIPDMLGDRLEMEENGRLKENASLCYICSGNIDKFINSW